MARRTGGSKKDETPKIDPAAEEAELVDDGTSEVEAVPDADPAPPEGDPEGASEVEAVPDVAEGASEAEGEDASGGDLVPAGSVEVAPLEDGERQDTVHTESGPTIAMAPDDHATLPPPDAEPVVVDDPVPVEATDAGGESTPERERSVSSVDPVPASPPARSGGGWGAGLIGGIVAAALALAGFWWLSDRSGPEGSERLASLEAALAAQAEEIETLRQEADALGASLAAASEPSSDPRIEELLGRTTGLEEGAARLDDVEAGLAGRLDALEAALADLAAAPVARPGDAADASLADIGDGPALASAEGLAQVRGSLGNVRDDLNALTARVDEVAGTAEEAAERIASLEAEIADRERAITEEAARQAEAAESAARSAEARAALREIEAAIASGTSWEGSLESLRAATEADVPAVLDERAPTGVATLAELQGSITQAVRQANALAPLPEGSNRATGTLARFVGLRSTGPREGDDPAAVLTRIENAAREGDLEAAVSEAEALPGAVRAPLDEWLGLARARLDAQDGVNALSAEIGNG